MIVFWGRQPIYSGPVARPAKAFLAAKQRGAKIIAIKPLVEPDVGMADICVPLRPGKDAALALAMLYVVIKKAICRSVISASIRLEGNTDRPAWPPVPVARYP